GSGDLPAVARFGCPAPRRPRPATRARLTTPAPRRASTLKRHVESADPRAVVAVRSWQFGRRVSPVEHVQRALVPESELKRALDCGELIRLYQPVVELRTDALVQVEALLRWDHRELGLLAPGDFLPGEDDSRLLVRLGWSVVIEAARRAVRWRCVYPDRRITVSGHLFASHLGRRELPDH